MGDKIPMSESRIVLEFSESKKLELISEYQRRLESGDFQPGRLIVAEPPLEELVSELDSLSMLIGENHEVMLAKDDKWVIYFDEARDSCDPGSSVSFPVEHLPLIRKALEEFENFLKGTL